MGCLLYRLILKCKHVFIVHIGKSKMFPLPQITDVVLQWKVNLLPMGGHGVVDIFCYQFICFVLCALCILNMLKFNPVCSVSVKFFFFFFHIIWAMALCLSRELVYRSSWSTSCHQSSSYFIIYTLLVRSGMLSLIQHSYMMS